jgi:hypothetical protein
VLKTEAAWALAFGISIFFVTIVNDMLFINEVISTMELAPFGHLSKIKRIIKTVWM